MLWLGFSLRSLERFDVDIICLLIFFHTKFERNHKIEMLVVFRFCVLSFLECFCVLHIIFRLTNFTNFTLFLFEDKSSVLDMSMIRL